MQDQVVTLLELMVAGNVDALVENLLRQWSASDSSPVVIIEMLSTIASSLAPARLVAALAGLSSDDIDAMVVLDFLFLYL